MVSGKPRFRTILDQLPTYKPGKTPVARAGKTYKLSSNESPYEPPPSVLKAISDAAGQVNRYPDPFALRLIDAVATRFQVPAEHIAVGAGSVGVTQQILQAVAEPGVEVVYAWRSFEAYPIVVDLTGATAVQVPLRDWRHDLAAMADTITDRTRLILVCNPNNPTGTVVRHAEVTDFLARVPEDVLIVLDEAYREYVRDADVPDGLTLYADRPNVAVLRTFSKAYGLAGLRVGFLVGQPEVAEAARKTMIPFAVNQVAQAAAVAALGCEAELAERVETTVKERSRLREALIAQGWTVPPSEANFVWLPLGADTADFAGACTAAGIAVRPFAGEGARVTVGDAEANDAFLAVAEAYPRRH